jgi:hypothetical protein
MAITTKKPFIYTQAHKYHGEPATSAGGSSTAPVLANNGVHNLVAASTYFLEGPAPGSLVTIFASGVDASVKSVTSTGGQVCFSGNGGTQVLNLLYDSTVLNVPSVTLVGRDSTSWVITGFGNNGAMATSNAGISVTT